MPRRLTVLVDGRAFSLCPNGGVTRYFREMFARVPARHPDICYLLHWPVGAADPPASPGLTLVRESAVRPARLFGPWNRARDRQRLRAYSPAVAHPTYFTANPFFNLPTVVTVHDMVDEHFFDGISGNAEGFRLHLRAFVSGSDHAIAVSCTTRDDILRWTELPSERVSVCPHGVSAAFAARPDASRLEAFAARHRTGAEYLLYVGRQTAYKNFHTLLEGWSQLHRGGRRIRLVCVGPMPAQHHVEILVQRRLIGEFVHIERLSDEELACAYAGARALVLPSLWEGFGIPVLEAAAVGAPLVLSDIPAFREVADGAALFFDPYDPASLAAVLEQVLTPDVADRLRQAGRRLPEKYGWDAAADHHADIYRRLAVAD